VWLTRLAFAHLCSPHYSSCQTTPPPPSPFKRPVSSKFANA
jgi:hypothetical protein